MRERSQAERMRLVTIEPHDRGDMLTEVVRAYMHGAMPCAMLGRIIAGLDALIAERDACTAAQGGPEHGPPRETGDVMPNEDRAFVVTFRGELETLRVTWRKRAEEVYG